MARRVAIVGAGMQKFARRKEESINEMIFEVAKDALNNAGLARDAIDAVVLGNAVDAFCGIHNSAKLAIEGCGGLMKPMMMNSTSGSTAVSLPILGYTHVASGLYDVVMVIAYEKMSENLSAQAVFNTVYDEVYIKPMGLNVPLQCGLEARRYLYKYGLTEVQMAKVSVKNRGNALSNPYAQMPMKITVGDVLNSPYISWPVKLLDTSPVTDGARALIFASEDVAREITDDPIWVRGVGRGANSCYFIGRRLDDLGRLDYAYLAAKQAYEMAGIRNPRTAIDYAELYDPFTYKEMQHCEAFGLCEEGGAGRMIDEGISLKEGKLPVNASGGLQGEGNPIAAGMSRLCWCYKQIKKQAGACQVPKEVNTAIANGWGGMYQYSAAMIIGRD